MTVQVGSTVRIDWSVRNTYAVGDVELGDERTYTVGYLVEGEGGAAATIYPVPGGWAYRTPEGADVPAWAVAVAELVEVEAEWAVGDWVTFDWDKVLDADLRADTSMEGPPRGQLRSEVGEGPWEVVGVASDRVAVHGIRGGNGSTSRWTLARSVLRRVPPPDPPVVGSRSTCRFCGLAIEQADAHWLAAEGGGWVEVGSTRDVCVKAKRSGVEAARVEAHDATFYVHKPVETQEQRVMAKVTKAYDRLLAEAVAGGRVDEAPVTPPEEPVDLDEVAPVPVVVVDEPSYAPVPEWQPPRLEDYL